MRLSQAGWPRPVNERGQPVPWYNDYDDLRITHFARYRACASGAICPICGLAYADGEPAYALLSLRQVVGTPLGVALMAPRNDPSTVLEGHVFSPMDNSVMHERCIRLSLAKCPHLGELIREGSLFLIGLYANSCDVEGPNDRDPRPHGTTAGGMCKFLGRIKG